MAVERKVEISHFIVFYSRIIKEVLFPSKERRDWDIRDVDSDLDSLQCFLVDRSGDGQTVQPLHGCYRCFNGPVWADGLSSDITWWQVSILLEPRLERRKHFDINAPWSFKNLRFRRLVQIKGLHWSKNVLLLKTSFAEFWSKQTSQWCLSVTVSRLLEFLKQLTIHWFCQKCFLSYNIKFQHSLSCVFTKPDLFAT